MQINPDDLNQLRQKMAVLQLKQEILDTELKQLKSALNDLIPAAPSPATTSAHQETSIREVSVAPPPRVPVPLPDKRTEQEIKTQKSIDLERFIGENLSSKIGAIITVLGVAIGLKYAIDNNLIGPLTRIIMGYSVAVIMFVISQRLRHKYLDLSAVILSGAVCIAYFTSYAAYVFYHLIPQAPTFGIMLGITAVTVWQALAYNRQVIAIGGLVGAYLIPFLLSDGSERPVFLFVYMSVINCGILYIALQRSWRIMQITAFFISWIILDGWCLGYGYSIEKANIGLTFTSIFFVIFTAMYISEKFHLKVPHRNWDTAFLILNGIFYLFPGYYLADRYDNDVFTGLFVFVNMAVYLGLSYAFYLRSGQAKPFGLLTIMGIVCLTLFFSDQFSNPVLTVCWAVELIVLYWIGRTQKLAVYEKVTIPLLLILAFDLLFFVAPRYYNHFEVPAKLVPLLNKYSLSFVSVITALVVVLLIHQKHRNHESEEERQSFSDFSATIFSLIFGLTYFYFFNEISAYFDIAYANSYDGNSRAHFEDIIAFKVVWLVNYTLFFISVLNFSVNRKNVAPAAKEPLVGFSFAGILLFLMVGLYHLGYLKNCYMLPNDGIYARSGWHLGIRYVSIVFLLLLVWTFYRLVKSAAATMPVLLKNFDLIVHGTALWLVGSELVHWLELSGLGDRSYKIALSILFGCWSVMLIILGIRQNRQNLRIAAIVLFAATLLKLFIYDLAQLNTLSKTVVMVSLGGLLLAISYLYSKFKEQIINQ